ncbi:histidine kinase [Streptomyces tubbatahanensis]|uniref:histidine kinase n=1 Tax=Streptomyces tubbatahanensis TaxID=2923272 RepID=A0ABY3XKX4_9ACTN|nr:histidine kinase [Streptomyces tubbatahanensis]UNS95046.1 histidine kinase [Streptomyces tubbatahanensis]
MGPTFWDTALWLLLSGIGLLWFLHNDTAASPLRDLVLPTAVLAGAVPGSRASPGAAVLAANGLCALGLANETTPATPSLLTLAVMSYLMGSRATTTRTSLLVFGASMVVDLALCAAVGVPLVWWFYVLTMVPLALLPPWLAGRYRRARAALVRGGWERAVSLEQRQRFVAEQARLRERTRIAADMHDSLGHELSMIALRAGALELEPALPDRHRADLTELRAAVSGAVDNLRDTIGVLRDAEPVPTASATESVEELVRRAVTSGVEVTLQQEGTVPVLAPLADRAVYRVVQESLTNATKHAPGTAVQVAVRHGSDTSEVRVTNSAPPAGVRPAGERPMPGNRGLAGLRERVAVIGGALRAGPHRGGFEVVATVPHRVIADRPQSAQMPSPKAGSESTQQLAVARRRARLRFAAAFLVPGALVLTVLPAAALLAYQLSTCVLRPAVYESLRVGEKRAAVEQRLPERQFRYPSDEMRAAPAPAGASCAFYRSNSNLLDEVDVYRLCYSDSRLVAKDVLSGRPEGS